MNRIQLRRPAVLLTALIGAYVIAVGLLISWRSAPLIGSETDGVYYMIASRTLFSNGFAPPTFGGGIGMPLAIAAVNTAISDTFRAAQIISALAGLVYLIATVQIFARIESFSLGVITGGLLLVSPILLINSASSLTDVLGACLPLAGLWLLLTHKSPTSWPVALAGGLLFGAAFAVRSVSIVFFPIALVATTSPAQRKVGKQMIACAAGLILGALPQLYVNQKYFGNPFYSENWRNTAALVFDWNYVNQLSSFSEVIKQAGPTLLITWVKRFIIDVPIALYHVAYLPLLFAVPGIFLMISKAGNSTRRVLVTWVICSLCYLILIAGVWRIELRYFLPVLPLVIAAGIIMWRHFAERSRLVFVTGLAFAILVSATVAVRDNHAALASQSTEFKQAGMFLREMGSSNQLILASQPSVFFYAERPGMLIENVAKEELDRLDTAATSRNIDWIVFDERRGYRDNPRLSWLLEPTSPLASSYGWQPVFVGTSPRIVVWRTQAAQESRVR